MTCSLSISGKAFADNPIQLTVESATRATYLVMWGSYQLFKGIATGTFTVNISEVIRGRFKNVGTWDDTASGYPYLLTPSDAQDNLLSCTVIVTDTDSTTWSQSFTAVRGGVPKCLFRQLTAAGTTFFALKDAVNGNNFFTVRSNGWRLSLKETELSEPLMFFMPSGGTGTIFVKSGDGSRSLSLSGTPGNFYGLDLAAIRSYWLTQYDELWNTFLIYNEHDTDEVSLACSIAIEEALPSVERYLVRFRNSLGCMEVIELVGHASMVPAAADDDNEVNLSYDAVTDSYTETRERVTTVETITVPSGVKRTDEVMLLRDMLNSDEVYFVADGEQWRVIPSCEELRIPLHPTEPQSYDLQFRMTEGEDLTGFCFVNGNFVKPRIFTNQFTEQFV